MGQGKRRPNENLHFLPEETEQGENKKRGPEPISKIAPPRSLEFCPFTTARPACRQAGEETYAKA